MPGEAVVAVEAGEPVLAQPELRAKLAVERVADRREHRQVVDAAVEEHRDDRRVGGAGRLGDARLERIHAEQLRPAVDRQREPGAAHEERPPAEAGAGGQRHPALDRRQALPGLGRGVPDERRAREAVAVPVSHQQVCMSGEVATSMRSAFWRRIG